MTATIEAAEATAAAAGEMAAETAPTADEAAPAKKKAVKGKVGSPCCTLSVKLPVECLICLSLSSNMVRVCAEPLAQTRCLNCDDSKRACIPRQDGKAAPEKGKPAAKKGVMRRSVDAVVDKVAALKSKMGAAKKPAVEKKPAEAGKNAAVEKKPAAEKKPVAEKKVRTGPCCSIIRPSLCISGNLLQSLRFRLSWNSCSLTRRCSTMCQFD